jgi:hypothetical protein
MAAIDVGAGATDRASSLNDAYTLISAANPANDSGTITSAEVWMYVSCTASKIGTFYLDSGTTYVCRDSQATGAIVSGSKQTITGLEIDATSGDLIGINYTSGGIELDTTGGGGLYYVTGEYIDPTDSASYTSNVNYGVSIYGIGTTVLPKTATVSLDMLLRDTDTKTVSLSMGLRDTDSEAVDLDTLLVDRMLVQPLLDALLRDTDAKSAALDALLRDTDSASVNLSALLRDVDWETVGLDALTVDRLIAAINLSALLRDTDSEAVNLSALIEATDSESIALDVILKDQTYNAPYYIEVRDPDGVLLGVIRDIIDGSLEQATNAPDVLSFTIPLNELRAQYLTRKNQIWVRDSATDSVISVCRIQMTEESD